MKTYSLWVWWDNNSVGGLILTRACLHPVVDLGADTYEVEVFIVIVGLAKEFKGNC